MWIQAILETNARICVWFETKYTCLLRKKQKIAQYDQKWFKASTLSTGIGVRQAGVNEGGVGLTPI